MTKHNDIEARIQLILAEVLGSLEGINRDTVLFSKGGGETLGDSLDKIEVIMEIEHEMGVEITEDAAANLNTINAITQFVVAQSKVD